MTTGHQNANGHTPLKGAAAIEEQTDAFEKQARENLKHLSNARMKRFLDQAQNLRRNLKLRKRQQAEREILKKGDC